MVKPKLIIFILILISCVVQVTNGQNKANGHDDARLRNGKLYQFSYTNLKGHPGYKQSSFTDGNEVYYDGQHFPDVRLFYDLIKQKLIYYDVQRNLPVALHSGLVKDFVIAGDTFTYKNAGDTQGLDGGFYKILFLGDRYQAYSKVWKELSENYASGQLVHEVSEHMQCFVLIGNVGYDVSTERTLRRLFQSEQVKMPSEVRFKENPETYLKMLLSLIDRIDE